MKRIVTAAVVAASLACAAPASADTLVELGSGVAPGISSLSRLDFKVNEGQYAFTRSCAPVEFGSVRYTGIRTRTFTCGQVARFIKRRTPSAFNCFYFPLRMTFVSEHDGATLYRSDVTRISCNRNSDGSAFAFTARS